MDEQRNKTWVEVDLDSISDNFSRLKTILSPGCGIMPIIKADGYGHGAVILGSLYEKLGASYFGVATIDEAIQLRNAGIKTPILLLGYTSPVCTQELIEYNITQTIYDFDVAKRMSDIAISMGRKLKTHLKVDTGMSRLGLFFQDENQDSKAIDTAYNICKLEGLEFEGILTHFAVADEPDDPFTKHQFELFNIFCQRLSKMGITFKIRHCCNSAAILNFPDMHLDMVRPGIILYGISPDGRELPDGFSHSLTLKSTVSNIKKIHPGSTVSYGRRFVAKEEIDIATIPVGYADGYSRNLSGKACMLIKGRRIPVLGSITMDQCMVDVSNIEDVKTGDEVTVFGGNEPLAPSVEEVGAWWGTIGYEVICQISKRITRIYIKDGKIVSSMSYIV